MTIPSHAVQKVTILGGSRPELLSKDGLYKRLYQMQELQK